MLTFSQSLKSQQHARFYTRTSLMLPKYSLKNSAICDAIVEAEKERKIRYICRYCQDMEVGHTPDRPEATILPVL